MEPLRKKWQILWEHVASSPWETPYSQPSQVFIWCHRTRLLWISHLSFRSIPWQGSCPGFLGLINTVACFVPNLVSMTEPIRWVTQKNSPVQSDAFENLCNLISSDTVLAHLDPSLPTQVHHDACKIGISGALTQKHADGSIRPVAYVSLSLSLAEQCYSQTEREALSAVWACERFHFYIHGCQFDLTGDHKLLEVLLTVLTLWKLGHCTRPLQSSQRWTLPEMRSCSQKQWYCSLRSHAHSHSSVSTWGTSGHHKS